MKLTKGRSYMISIQPGWLTVGTVEEIDEDNFVTFEKTSWIENIASDACAFDLTGTRKTQLNEKLDPTKVVEQSWAVGRLGVAKSSINMVIEVEEAVADTLFNVAAAKAVKKSR